MRPPRWAGMAALILLLPAPARASSISYTITDLGTLPGTSTSAATGINNLGQVVGSSGNQSFLYGNGQMTAIIDPISGGAGGINDSGQVVSQGQYINSSGQVVSQPFQVPVTTTVNGVTTTVQATFNPTGINDAGQVSGWVQGNGIQPDAAIYQDGKLVDLGKALGLTGVTEALAINNAGSVIISDYNRASQSTTMLLYKADGTTQVLNMNGTVFALNNLGQVLSNGELGSSGPGTLYSNGQYLSLLQLLPPSSQSLWQFLNPAAINDEGQIVGAGIIDGQQHAFLMTPTPTPEPSTLAMLATAIAATALRRWGRRGR